MAADLHIHVLDGATEDDLRCSKSHTLGSKYFSLGRDCAAGRKPDRRWGCRHVDAIDHTPNVWVGEVSWLKAAIFEDGEQFIPDIVARVNDIVGEDLPIIDDDFMGRIREAFNEAKAHDFYDATTADKVLAFLNEHRGKQVFTISW